ncbi:MAG: transcription-repair coupling factor [Succinivibrionaceae bacterium]|nr:transcription-repair coupling factor [Succinivibrionaceae bacterium]
MIPTELLDASGNRVEIFGTSGPAASMYIASRFRKRGNTLLVITESTQRAKQLMEELEYLLPESPVLSFPDYETLPYDIFAPQQDLISDRLETLYCLKTGMKCIAVTPVSAALGRITSPDYVLSSAMVLKKGQRLSMTGLAEILAANGYQRAAQVYSTGEFAVRGSLIDLFPAGLDEPCRVDFFDDEIDSIRIFDAESQRTVREVRDIRLLPAREFPIQPPDIERFRRKYREAFGASLDQESVYQQVSGGRIPSGIEYYLPLFLEHTSSLTDYLPEDAQVILTPGVKEQAEIFLDYVASRQGTDETGGLRPRLAVAELYHQTDELLHLLKKRSMIVLKKEAAAREKDLSFKLAPLPDVSLKTGGGGLKELKKYIGSCPDDSRFLFSVYSAGRLETICDLLSDIGVTPREVKTFDDFDRSDARFCCIVSPFDEGRIFEATGARLVTETEIFGSSYVSSKRSSKNVHADAVIRNLAELKIGDLIVHYKYGIGRYRGLEIQNIGGINKEFFCLEYADDARLYVEITELHLISRYMGAQNPKLSALGSDVWEKNRRKAQEKVKDVAAQLLDVYARRAVKRGCAFSFDRASYSRFVAEFPYEETQDQQKAINAVIADMTSERTMDRLVCGDVGFGKTEVAIRAAFIAATAGRQVAVLVPTVLLAEQHYDTFRTRFAKEAINIAVLSRFKTGREQSLILDSLASGATDIVIGTHKLLSKKIKYKDLGLLIVDEEHRFGVQQKEVIKSLRTEVDILTLTATPIPRTLNMAFSGLRDLSLITTPPARRLAIKTFLHQKDDAIVKEAVSRELKRGGQVYYLYNDVATIDQRTEELSNLLPEATIRAAHGQMRERDLAMIMNQFYHHRFDVLVCSTIIENGIDVPAANTIVIEHADRFGLAQLHQIRGRVGRSNRQAYAYLLIPPEKLLTSDAQKRLKAITMHDDLGAGFALASHDLEIRGAGELLGEEQSGQIAAVGFTLYMEMLSNATAALKNGREVSLDELESKDTEINLNVSAVIPSDYMGDISTRLSFYKQISSAGDPRALKELKDELRDRYGPIPELTENLFALNSLRLRASALGISGITVSKVTSFVKFGDQNKTDPAKIVAMMQKSPADFRLDGSRIRLLKKIEPEECLAYVEDLIRSLE